MDVREKLVELLGRVQQMGIIYRENQMDERYPTIEQIRNTEVATRLIANGVTVQECGEWVHPKGYVVSNGFLCSKCGHEESSHYPINPRLGGGCIADENGNFFYPPKLNYCPNCGAKMISQPPKGE